MYKDYSIVFSQDKDYIITSTRPTKCTKGKSPHKTYIPEDLGDGSARGTLITETFCEATSDNQSSLQQLRCPGYSHGGKMLLVTSVDDGPFYKIRALKMASGNQNLKA